MITEFRNQVAQKASPTTTNHDLKAIKLLFRSAKRDGYIIEDPSEFVESDYTMWAPKLWQRLLRLCQTSEDPGCC